MLISFQFVFTKEFQCYELKLVITNPLFLLKLISAGMSKLNDMFLHMCPRQLPRHIYWQFLWTGSHVQNSIYLWWIEWSISIKQIEMDFYRIKYFVSHSLQRICSCGFSGWESGSKTWIFCGSLEEPLLLPAEEVAKILFSAVSVCQSYCPRGRWSLHMALALPTPHPTTEGHCTRPCPSPTIQFKRFQLGPHSFVRDLKSFHLFYKNWNIQ